MKVCVRCGAIKPLDAFNKDKNRADGLTPQCRDCRAASGRAHYARNREKELARRKAYYEKYPERLREVRRRDLEKNKVSRKERNDSYYAKHPEKLVAVGARYYESHKAQVNARTAAWKRANPDKVRAAAARPEQKERASAWRKANSEKLRLIHARKYRANRERIKARTLKWAKEHPESTRASKAKRRAKKAAVAGKGVSTRQLREVLADSLGICAYCNGGAPLAVDHIEPLFRGGEHDKENLAPACQSCNSSKRDRILLVWLAQRAALRRAA